MFRQLRCEATLLACLVTAAVVGADINPYCDVDTCPKLKHTMCQFPNDSVACPGEGVQTGLSEDLKKTIVDLHNTYRSEVALAHNFPQPAASDMMRLSWHKEAAEIAQRWANQCVFHDDVCRDLLDAEVGQNMAEFQMNLIRPDVLKTIRYMVNEWYNEAKDEGTFVKDQLHSFQYSADNVGRIVGHYTQMVWAKTTGVGCGYIQMKAENKLFRDTHLVCNYVPGGNIKGQPIYKVGRAGSACPDHTQCSKSYPGLCTEDKDDFGKCPWVKDKSGASSLKPTACLLLTVVLLVKKIC